MIENDDQWSDALRQATRDALDELAFSPASNFVRLKNTDGRFSTIAIDELLKENLKMIDRQSRHEMVFTNVDDIIRAGWVID